MTREQTLDRLAGGHFDLLVVGAGIVGARIADDAAHAGLSVALLDAGDIGGATSGASSKLVHGGFRYLALGRPGLVRESRLEQHALRTRVAPHLTRELPMVLAVDREAEHGPREIGAGLRLYHALSGFRARAGGLLPAGHAARLVPGLALDRAAGYALLYEAQTHDARLTLATARSAAAAGAVVCNHVRVVALERAGGRLVGAIAETREGDVLAVRCRAAVNAAGPWVDAVRRLEDPATAPSVRLSKGVHAVLPAPPGWRAALAVFLPGRRAAFALPWHGVLLVGVTDTPFDGDPADARPEVDDVEELLGALRPYLPRELARPRLLSAFAGLRVLPRGDGDTLVASREHVVTIGPAGLVSVAGGKLTTHRRIALDALRRLPGDVRPRGLRLRADALPGAGRPPEPATPVAAHLVSLYGTEAARLLAGDLEPIHPDGPDVWAQIDHAAAHEWAVTAEDAARRTTLAVRGLASGAVLERIAERLAGGVAVG